MFLKLLTALVVLTAAGMMIAGRRVGLPERRTASPSARAAPSPRVPQAEDLVKCGRCGVWLPAGQRCGCAGDRARQA